MTTLRVPADPQLNESARITAIVQRAADAAYQARVSRAIERRFHSSIAGELDKARREQNLTEDRWLALGRSSREAESAQEFRAFARALSVSPRWLATGAGWIHEPPAGWFTFGTHAEQDLQLEFSVEVDDALMPLWERPRLGVQRTETAEEFAGAGR